MAAKDDDILEQAREEYAEGEDAWSEIKTGHLEDLKFGRLGEQWPQDIMARRRAAGRPCMTINRMPAFGRQVVNDARQNRPSVKVRPVDSGADVETAEIYSGLIRHIESISDADVAYDTAIEGAVYGGFGFVHVDVDYACDDSFDLEIKICQVSNPLAVTWDARTEAYDSSDWDYGFLSYMMDQEKFKAKYPGKQYEASDFVSDAHIAPWFEGKSIRLAKYYSREEKARKIVLLSDGSVLDEDVYAKQKDIFDQAGITFVKERETKSYEVVQRLITGRDILEEKRWKLSAIPIVPVYGDSFFVESRRYLNSLIHDAKDSQRIFNFSRSTATELISLAPKAPWIGRKGTFTTDVEKWSNANTENHPYIEYDGAEPPQRQPFAGLPVGAIQEATMAADDMKQIIGIHDASLGVPGNEISGKAIRYRQHEGDVSTYHFVDNQHRSIRGIGRITMELIPQVYSRDRVIRTLGFDGKVQTIPLGQAVQKPDGTQRIYDLTVGKYDVSIEAGPSYTTRREEATDALSTIISAAPQTAPILAPMLVKMFDMPDSEKVSKMLATAMPPAARAVFDGTQPPPPQPPPEVMVAQQKAQADMAISHQKAQQDFQLEQQANANKLQIEQAQAQADMATMQQKAALEMQIARERAAMEMQLKREEAQLAAQLKMIGASQAAAQATAPGVA